MAYKIEFHPDAESEFWESVNWYEEEKELLGHVFANTIREALFVVQQKPNLFPKVLGERRKATVRSFPFVIIYEVSYETIYILAIFHTHRDPKSWAER